MESEDDGIGRNDGTNLCSFYAKAEPLSNARVAVGHGIGKIHIIDRELKYSARLQSMNLTI